MLIKAVIKVYYKNLFNSFFLSKKDHPKAANTPEFQLTSKINNYDTCKNCLIIYLNFHKN